MRKGPFASVKAGLAGFCGRFRLLLLCRPDENDGEKMKGFAMLDPKKLEELSAKLGAIIAASPVADIEKNARALLSTFFTKLDLVSREEFDIQSQVLQRTREKLEALEARVAKLEAGDTNSGK